MGATTYYIATKVKNSRKVEEQSTYSWAQLQELKDRSRREVSKNEVPPPLVTFVDLYGRASVLARQLTQRKKVKIYFDSNDEFVTEDAIPEVLES